MKVDFVFPVTPVLNSAGQVMTSHRSIADAVEAATNYPEGEYTYTIPIRMTVEDAAPPGEPEWLPAGEYYGPNDGAPTVGWYGNQAGVFRGEELQAGDEYRVLTTDVQAGDYGMAVGPVPFVYELRHADGSVERRVHEGHS